MFVDASAFVAMILREPEAQALADRLEAAPAPITSALALYETVLAIARQRGGGIAAAREDVRLMLEAARVRVVAITPEDTEGALDAFSRYGKGQGHPAQLNMGDRFAYASARSHRVPLLFKGNDFSHTDLANEGA